MPVSSNIPKIILDTDPGGDDIFVLLWLQSFAKQGLAELIAVTTAGGNVSTEKTFSSASRILGLGGLAEVEVGRGVTIAHSPNDASHIHGNDGMGNLSSQLPDAIHSYEMARHSDDLLIDRLNAMPGEITIVAIAPLTNLAAAEKKASGVLRKAKEIIIMGGAFSCPGNITSHAEFNVWFDPEAAEIVLNSRCDLVITPLDITRRLIFTREVAQSIVQSNPHSELAQFLISLCEFMIGTALEYRETNGISGFLVHDAATLGYLFYPETMMWKRARVQIETRGEWTRGQTLIDDRNLAKQPANAWVATEVDAARFFTSLIEDLKTLISMQT
ncbi:nucleoside hydrolase [Cyanobacteria bacterium FACHB-DQ100]|uniref:nucleoside hydrolase n=1 Tax=Leptolyngbya sp. DQ-M1 TaxID=2933920 RepID=UPI0019B0E6D1|nr:nucleoside hydrolase [Cyanobacteria bacterium FACHB-DQ100]